MAARRMASLRAKGSPCSGFGSAFAFGSTFVFGSAWGLGAGAAFAGSWALGAAGRSSWGAGWVQEIFTLFMA